MAAKSVKSEAELTEGDRLRIAHARAVLQEYGLHVDVAEMSDVAYERRNARMKAMDLAAASAGKDGVGNTEWLIDRAKWIYKYIWEGKD